MIEIKNEKPLTFKEAARHLPRRRRDKPVHLATFYRWAQKGIGGVRLETIQVGGTLCTSLEALQRFFEKLSHPGSDPEAPRSALTRQKSSENAARELREAGI